MAKLNKIKVMLQQMLLQFNQVSTDKGILRYDGDELKEDIGVVLIDEEGNESRAEDGDYYLGDEDGRTLVIVDSIIKEIREKDEEPEVENEDSADQETFQSKKRNLFEESYDEKTRKIAEAIRSAGFDGWVIEAGDDFAVVELWDSIASESKLYRFSISWDEEGNAIIGEYNEVKPAFVPVEEDVPETSEEVREDEENDYKAQNEQLRSQIVELKKQLDELKNQPASAPAEEQFNSINGIQKTGNRKLDAFINKMSK